LRSSPTNARWAIVAAVAALAMPAAAQAQDRITMPTGISYSGLITGLAPEGLVIRTTNDIVRTVALADIKKVRSDRVGGLEKLEDDYAAAVSSKAAAQVQACEKAYKSLIPREGVPPWLKLLAQWRLFPIYAEARRTPEALDAFLEIAKGCPKAAEALRLPPPPDGAQEVNTAMLKKVETALAAAGNLPYANELKNFSLKLKMQVGSNNPAEVMALLNQQLGNRDERIRQDAMLKRVEILMGSGQVDQAAPGIEELYRGPLADPSNAPQVVYWHGRVLEERKKSLEAALDYMRVAILYPAKDKALTADALWRAGQQLEAAKAPKAEFVKVYDEAAAKYAGTPGADRAKRELVRLGSS